MRSGKQKKFVKHNQAPVRSRAIYRTSAVQKRAMNCPTTNGVNPNFRLDRPVDKINLPLQIIYVIIYNVYYTKIKFKKNSFQSQKHYNPGSEKQNVTLSTKLFFYSEKNDIKKRLRNQSPRGFTRTNKNSQYYTGVTFSGIYISKTPQEEPSRKKHENTSHSHATRGFCTSL